MKIFKFLQRSVVKQPRIEPGLVKLKDAHNRNKYLLCDWSEYPYRSEEHTSELQSH